MILSLSNGFTNPAGCLIALRSGRDALRRVLGTHGTRRSASLPPDQAKLGPTVRPGPGAKAKPGALPHQLIRKVPKICRNNVPRLFRLQIRLLAWAVFVWAQDKSCP